VCRHGFDVGHMTGKAASSMISQASSPPTN
jgi:hypothetical protein